MGYERFFFHSIEYVHVVSLLILFVFDCIVLYYLYNIYREKARSRAVLFTAIKYQRKHTHTHAAHCNGLQYIFRKFCVGKSVCAQVFV